MREPSTGAGLVGSQVTNLKFFIEEAPGLVPVAGLIHRNQTLARLAEVAAFTFM
jgi:hypothetical protein